jgi:hypothetical protein
MDSSIIALTIIVFLTSIDFPETAKFLQSYQGEILEIIAVLYAMFLVYMTINTIVDWLTEGGDENIVPPLNGAPIPVYNNRKRTREQFEREDDVAEMLDAFDDDELLIYYIANGGKKIKFEPLTKTEKELIYEHFVNR